MPDTTETEAPVQRRAFVLGRRVLWALVGVASSLGVALGASFYPGGNTYSQSEITQFFANSSNSFLSNNASTFGAISWYESGRTGNTGVYNGSCCTGLMQFNGANVAKYAGTTPENFATWSGQKQIDAYTKYFDKVSQEPGNRRAQDLANSGGYIGDHKVDAHTVAACAQFGDKNCRAAIANNCSDKRNGFGGDGYRTVCGLAEESRKIGGKANPGKNCSPTGTGGTTGSGTGGGTTPSSSGGGTGSGSSSSTPGSSSSASKGAACEEPEKNLDKTSKTCKPTIPMLQAIPCEKYPSNLQAFCQKYKPLQMNMDECQAAEKYAEKAAKGNRQTECENQTFGKGTSAWSFVLACSYAKTDQGQLGDATQAKQQTSGSSGSGGGQTTGTESDPQCVNKLRAKIPDLKVLGQYSFGGGCTVPSAVRFRGKAVDFGSELTMDCSLAEKMEEFGEALKGMGVTRMTNYGTLACRNIRNASGTSNSKSSHGYGMAVDIVSFRTGSGEISVTKYFSDQSARNFLENQVLPLACKTFKGVLGPRFYKGKYLHYHFETKTRTRCDGSG